MLQYVAVCCSVMQWVEVCCSVLQHVALRYNVLLKELTQSFERYTVYLPNTLHLFHMR